MPLGFAPTALAIADVNGDGLPDAVAVGDDGLAISLGSGQGALQAVGQTSLANFLLGNHVSLATGDWNGDGAVDLAVGDSVNEIHVLINDGSGNFADSPIFTMGPAASLHAADMDGDGRADLLFSALGGEQLALGLSDGGFWVTPAHVDGMSAGQFSGDETLPTRMIDLDGNGRSSALVLDGATFPSGLLDILDALPDAGGLFQSGQLSLNDPDGGGSAAYLTRFEVADLDGDGIADLVAIDGPERANAFLVWAYGLGNRQFGPPHRMELGPTPLSTAGYNYKMYLARLDGRVEVLVDDGKTVRVFRPETNGQATLLATYAIFSLARAVSADLNQDGHDDVLVAHATTLYTPATNDVQAILNLGDGGLAAPISLGLGEDASRGRNYPVAADLNGDGRADLAIGHSGAGYAFDLFGGLADGLAPPVAGQASVNGINLAAMDITRDNRIDLVANAYGGLSVFAGLPDGGFDAAQRWSFLDAGNLLLADVVGDSAYDLIGPAANGTALGVAVAEGYVDGGHGDFQVFSTNFISALSPNGYGLTTADVNGDNHVDIITCGDAGSAEVAVLLNATDGGFVDGGSIAVNGCDGLRFADLGNGPVLLISTRQGLDFVAGLGTGTPELVSSVPDSGFSPLWGTPAAVANLGGAGPEVLMTDGSRIQLVSQRTDGGFALRGASYAGGSIQSVVLDADGDGRPDVVVGSTLFLNRCPSN
ncbi:MAG: VCBS repeat-containing protein [Deltaproteobacteria bacterium]|nr:VCBS repeat-containing protein [Deltaproteobacteria bacterium]